MATARALIVDAMRMLRAIAPGDDPTADELDVGLDALTTLMQDLHEAAGPLLTIDVMADVVPAENQRIRIQPGFNVAVTLPNSVPLLCAYDPYDYGFMAGAGAPPVGSTAAADGVSSRAPRDFARIEIIGVQQGLWFFRDDLNDWVSAVALELDDESPINGRLTSSLGAVLAERMMDVLADIEPTDGLKRRIAKGNQALRLRVGARRDPVRAQYF
jgi:hypothetical protein